MSNFYVIGSDAEAIKQFFSVLPEDKRPKIVSDKEYPAVWDHVSDGPTIIATDEPRLDADAKQLDLEGKQVDEVMEQIAPPADIVSEEPALQIPEEPEEPEPVKGPHTYADRGFKVGRLL